MIDQLSQYREALDSAEARARLRVEVATAVGFQVAPAEMWVRLLAAMRDRLDRHAPIPDHGRFSEDFVDECPPGMADDCDCSQREPVCKTCRDFAGDHEPAPCPDLLADLRALLGGSS